MYRNVLLVRAERSVAQSKRIPQHPPFDYAAKSAAPLRAKVSLPAELESLPLFREFIANAVQSANISAENSYDVQLAVDEICTNIIMYGYKDMQRGLITINAATHPEKFIVIQCRHWASF